MADGLSVRGLSGIVPGPFDLEVPAGSCTLLTGPSGVGKSLLLRMIADLDPNQGEVAIGTLRRDAMPAPAWRRMVTYVAAESGWWADRTGDHMEDAGAARALLPALGLAAQLLDAPPSRLSTGERQRMALVRAICQHPLFLLLDEPTSALDHDTTLTAESLVRHLASQGMGILVVSHDRGQAERLQDRSYHLTRQGLVAT